MPILAYESHEEWQHSARCIRRESLWRTSGKERPKSSASSQTEDPMDPMLIRGYLYPEEGIKPLHSRRTLDQYSYYMLKSTERRDKDQVVYRWAKRERPSKRPKDACTPILMVDQLWLWVIPDGICRLSIFATMRS